MRHDHFAERAAKTLEEMAASLEEEDMRRVGGVFFSGRGPWRALALPLAPIHPPAGSGCSREPTEKS